ncbi:OmpA family protein [Acinetobacter sp. MD2]|uniref:OmpA family protein n=1 Tax=Acinetobacter sp. MD2 TaxID=2600066 RepID=UPI002D1F42E9|nr:OmpA family protein [Acinetobacter sp. MD2]MEB3768109.1 OmpA family protein [Acinetobacter sp. MD2]
MFKRPIKFGFILLLSSILSACAGLGHLSYKQAHMLKKEGFILTDEGWNLALPERLLFNFNDYTIAQQQTQDLTLLSNQLYKYKLNKIKVVGHTDDIGGIQYNQELSLKRANSVAEIFLTHGFNTSNVQIIGKGSSQPMVENDNDENRAKNRRVNIIIIP